MNKILIAILLAGLIISGYAFVKPKTQPQITVDPQTQANVETPNNSSIRSGSKNDLDDDLKNLDQEINVGSKDVVSENDLEL